MELQRRAEPKRGSIAPGGDDDGLMTSVQVRQFCGGVSDMTVWRWLRDERVQFPKPVSINKRNYWRRGDLRAWQAMHAAKV